MEYGSITVVPLTPSVVWTFRWAAFVQALIKNGHCGFFDWPSMSPLRWNKAKRHLTLNFDTESG